MSKAKTKNELQTELEQAYKRIAELEAAESKKEELFASAFDPSPSSAPMADSQDRFNTDEYKKAEQALLQSERQYHLLIDALDVSLCRWLPDTTLTYANEKYRQIFGVQDDAVGQKWINFLPEETRAATAAFYGEVAENPRTVTYEHPVTAEDGSVYQYHWIDTPILNDRGEVLEFQSVGIDITERKQAEQALRFSEAKWRSLFETCPVGIGLATVQGEFLDVNPAYLAQFGYTRDELTKKHYEDFTPPKWHAREAQNVVQLKATGLPIYFEKEHIRKDGTVFPVALTGWVIHDESGMPDILGVFVQDITSLKQAELELRESEERHRLISEISSDYVYSGKAFPDGSSQTAWISGAFEGITDYSFDEIVQRPGGFSSLIFPEDLKKVIAQQSVLLESGTATAEYRITRKDGEVRWLRDNMKLIEGGGSGKPAYLLGAVNDITAQKLAEIALRESESRYRLLVETSIEGIWTMDREHRTTYVNQSMADMLGYEPAEMIGKKVEDFFFPEDMESHQTHMEKRHSGQDEVYERRFRLRDGSQLWTLASARVQKDSQGNFNGSFAMFTDITKRKQAEESLRESEEKYHGLMESLNNAISTVDQYGTFLYMNDMAAESLGGTPQELIGKKIQEVFPEPFASRQLAAVLGVIQTDRDTWYETQSMVKNGLRWFRVAFQPLHDKAGQVAQILVNVTDIHDLKTAQQELQELNRTLEEKVSQRTAEVQDLYNNAPTGYHSLDIGGNFVMVNKTELNWLGYTREELIGRAAWDILTEDSRGIFREKFPLFLQQGWLKDLELEFVRKDGSILPVSLTATAIHDGDGNFVMSRSSILDITERKEAERALRESGEQNRLLFEESPSPIALLDETGHLIRTNHAYEQLTGVPRSRLYGKTAEEMGLVEPEVTKRLAESMIESMSRQENFARAEYCLVSADGTKRIVESHIFILQINSVNHVLVTVNDISMHKKAEETLRRANLELEHAMRVKDEFLATMSHELRTPLTGILGLSEALQLETYGSLTDRQVKTIRNIENSGRHLLELINDVLDLSKIEAGKLELEITHCSLEDICQASLQLTKGMAHQKRQRVSYSMSIDPIFLDVDSRRIKQVMVNLISNAIKFTPEDGELGLMVEQDKTNRQVRLIVWDKGIGIKPENLPKLFQPFTQIDSSLAREYSGTGLGLALVRRLVELHNGSVEVESIFGTGSRFIVTLPYVAPSLPDNSLPAEGIKELQHGATDEDLSSPMILIVDDNQLLLDMMSDFLEAKQFRTVKSQSGRELLEKIEDINPDVILMDIQMPVMDGLEAIRRIRAHKNAKIASTLIIAVTALAMPGDREKCLETGANEYLSKPIFLAQLVERIREFLKDKDGRQST